MVGKHKHTGSGEQGEVRTGRKKRHSALFTKSIRDMKKSIAQFISIFIMALIAVAIVSGLDAIWVTVQNHSDTIYEAGNAADMWITVPNPSERDMWKVQNIEGIKKAEKRLRMNVKVDLEGEPTLTVYAAQEDNTMDQPYMVEGRWSKTSGVILDTEFAAAHNLTVGERLRIQVNGRFISCKIEGLCMESEHIFSVKDTSYLMPAPRDYGFMMMNIDLLREAFYGQRYYNQIEVQLWEGADKAAIQKELDAIFGDRLIGVQTHKDAGSYVMVDTQISQFKILSTIFSFMFFVVAALITLSTMMRLVEDQRAQIGTMKAFGYSKRIIMWHYMSYGVYIGLLGALFGCVIGPNILTRLVIVMLRGKLTLPSYRIGLYWTNILLATLILVVCTGGISAYSCSRLLGEMPSELLRPKPPRKGSHIFLERFWKLWDKLKFSYKLIARNLARNKMRFFMSTFGVMGCTALIVAAFTIRSTLMEVSPDTYGHVYTYDEKLFLDGNTSLHFCNNLKLNAVKQTVEETGIYMRTAAGYYKMVTVTVTTKDSPLMHLSGANGRGEVMLPDDGVVMTRKQAENMGVKVGDTVYLKRMNHSYVPVLVKGITLKMAGQGIYMTDTFYESLGETYTPSALLVKWEGEPDLASAAFLRSDRVTSRMTLKRQKNDIDSSLNMVTLAITLLILCGAALAFVVIYNMGMLNFHERIRDLSTLMVLGFYKKEIQALVLVDNILSTAIGIVLGMPIGKILANISVVGLGEEFDMAARLTAVNIFWSAALTILFAVAINLFLRRKMKGIDMLEALKSVE